MKATLPVLFLGCLLACNKDSGSDSGSTGGPVRSHADGGDKKPPGWNSVVGEKGLFLQSFDGTGFTARTLAAEDLLAVSCASHALGWAAGDRGLLARTEDAGATWTRLAVPAAAALRAVRFVDGAAREHLLGLLAGDAGTLLLSRDGGDSFERVALPASVRGALRGIAIARGGAVLVVVGDGGTVVRSANGGATFSAAVVAGAADLRAVAAGPAGLIVAVDSRGAIWESDDDAAGFHRAAGAANGLEAISMESGVALAAGAAGTALLRGPDGRWQSVATGTDADLHAALIDRAEGADGNDPRMYLAGAAGTLLSSTDGGRSFQAIPLAGGPTAALYGMEDFR